MDRTKLEQIAEMAKQGRFNQEDILALCKMAEMQLERQERRDAENANWHEKLEKLKDIMHVSLWQADWDEPSDGDLKELQSVASDILGRGDLDNDEETSLKDFIDAVDKEEYLEKIDVNEVADICKREINRDALCASTETTLEVTYTTGGPSIGVKFHEADTSGYRFAEAYYGEFGSETVTLPLPREMADTIFEEYSHSLDQGQGGPGY